MKIMIPRDIKSVSREKSYLKCIEMFGSSMYYSGVKQDY